MKTIVLTQDRVALVDDADFAWLSQFKWHAHYTGGKWYPRRKVQQAEGDTRDCVRMHQFIIGDGADHIDGNGLNNQRSNLRVATSVQNNQNTGLRSHNTSGFMGVYKYKNRKSPWWAYVNSNNKRKSLGYFDTPEDAARAYDAAAIELHGEFARTNQSEGLFA